MIQISNDAANELLKILRKRESQQIARSIIAGRQNHVRYLKVMNALDKTRLLIEQLNPKP